jgi:prepilin-type N-terminal cleavage/methylation domain-containing protein
VRSQERHGRRRGSCSSGSAHVTRDFTLVELMVVVAIVVVLTAIAVPGFNQMQLKAKRSEVPLNIDGIATAHLAYGAAHDRFLFQTSWVPNGTFTKKARAWTTTSTYQAIGFRPDGAVRGGYYSPSWGTNGVDTVGRCDVDNDNVNTLFLARIEDGVVLDQNTMVSLPDTY